MPQVYKVRFPRRPRPLSGAYLAAPPGRAALLHGFWAESAPGEKGLSAWPVFQKRLPGYEVCVPVSLPSYPQKLSVFCQLLRVPPYLPRRHRLSGNLIQMTGFCCGSSGEMTLDSESRTGFMTPAAWWEGLSLGIGPELLLGPLAVSFPRSMGAKDALLCLRVEPPHGLCVASLQGWSSFATGASRFASAAKEGVSTRPSCDITGQATRGPDGAPATSLSALWGFL